jgi:two-component system sensor kinase FixL
VAPARPGSGVTALGDELHKAVLAAVLDPTLTIDERGLILTASSSVRDVFGWPPEELVGREVSILMPEPHRSQQGEYLARYHRTGVTNILGRTRAFEVLRKDGSSLFCELSVARADLPGGHTVFIGSLRDITELKRAQRTETAMLRAMATIGEQAALLAHEIKNPITAVNLALRAVARELGEDHRAILEDLVQRMQRLERIMRRTLSFTKPLELKPSTFAVNELFARVVDAMEPEIAAAGATVRCHAPAGAKLHADRQLVEEVLTNLLRNAIEAQTGKVSVRLDAQRVGRRLAIHVDDDGPGIPESLRATLFKPFVTTKKSGTGLGLAFCRKVALEHEGSIEASKCPLGGARITLELDSEE